jgi:hypothetical protein
MVNITLFSQIISKLDRQKFNKLVRSRQSDKHQKGFDSWSHLVSMLFCQFAKSQSLRDISNGLRSATGNLNHLGMVQAPLKIHGRLSEQKQELGTFQGLLLRPVGKSGTAGPYETDQVQDQVKDIPIGCHHHKPLPEPF